MIAPLNMFQSLLGICLDFNFLSSSRNFGDNLFQSLLGICLDFNVGSGVGSGV